MGIPPVPNSGFCHKRISGLLPLLLEQMDSDKQYDTEDVRRIAEENRKAIERVREELRKLKARIGTEKTEGDDRLAE